MRKTCWTPCATWNASPPTFASWIMNLGKGNFPSSTMLKRIREGKWEAAAKEMKRWDKVTVGGKKKPFRALTRRRLTEAHLFLTGEVKTFL